MVSGEIGLGFYLRWCLCDWILKKVDINPYKLLINSKSVSTKFHNIILIVPSWLVGPSECWKSIVEEASVQPTEQKMTSLCEWWRRIQELEEHWTMESKISLQSRNTAGRQSWTTISVEVLKGIHRGLLSYNFSLLFCNFPQNLT